jgi:hypothetical protein
MATLLMDRETTQTRYCYCSSTTVPKSSYEVNCMCSHVKFLCWLPGTSVLLENISNVFLLFTKPAHDLVDICDSYLLDENGKSAMDQHEDTSPYDAPLGVRSRIEQKVGTKPYDA